MNGRSVKKVPTSDILKVALTLFSSKGYAETRMTEIARNTGLSVGTLYLRFRSKEDLCLELVKDQTKDFDRLAKGLVARKNDALKTLNDYIVLNLEYAFKKRPLISMLMREHRLPFLRPLRRSFFESQMGIISDILRAGVLEGAFRPVNYEETALMIFAGIRGVIQLRLNFEVDSSIDLGSLFFELIGKGIRKDGV